MNLLFMEEMGIKIARYLGVIRIKEIMYIKNVWHKYHALRN